MVGYMSFSKLQGANEEVAKDTPDEWTGQALSAWKVLKSSKPQKAGKSWKKNRLTNGF